MLLIALVVISFSRLAGAKFTYLDDPTTIIFNPNLRPPTVESLQVLWSTSAFGLYVPATYTVWWVLALLTGATPLGGPPPDASLFHVTNIAVHALAVVLVFQLLRRLFNNPIAALLGSAVFAVHPLQAETVAWSSGLKDVLCGFWTLLALNLYVGATDRSDKPARAQPIFARPTYWLGMAALVVGMLSKPTAMVTPFIALMIDVVLRKRPIKLVLKSLAPWCIAIMPFVIITKLVQNRDYMPGVPIWGRPLIAGDALAYYLAKLIAPFNLSIDPGRRPDWIWSNGQAMYATLVPAALAILIWIFRRRIPSVAAGSVIALIGLLPVLGLVPFAYQYFSTTSGHYMYLPMLGVAIAVAGVLSRFEARWPLVAASALIVGCSACTIAETGYWLTPQAHASHMIEVNPASFLGHDLLGQVLLGRGDVAGAATHFQRSIEILPTYPQALKDQGELLLRSNDPAVRLRGMNYLRDALDARARQKADVFIDDSHARLTLGAMYASLGELTQAKAQLERVIQDGTDPEAVAEARDALDAMPPQGTTGPSD